MLEKLLETPHEMQVGISVKTGTIGFFVSQEQSKAQASFTDHAVRGFMVTFLPNLRSNSDATKKQKHVATKTPCNTEIYKKTGQYYSAWKNACLFCCS